MNNRFVSVFTEDNNTPLILQPPEVTQANIEFVDFSLAKIKSHANKLKPKLSSGTDLISSAFIKQYIDYLCYPLYVLFNVSFDTSKLPLDWLSANIMPIPKTPSPSTNFTLYRPISLTSNVCRLMERIIKEAIVDHLHKNSLISPFQHGFMSLRSTVTQLVETVNTWSTLVDRKHSVDVIYLDCAKAFDTVSHSKLLQKIHSYGIKGKLYDWIKAFLANRRQRTVVNGRYSTWSNVKSGVPQGSVLGPVLFLIYINDIVEVIRNGNIRLYADDCKLFFTCDSNAGHLALQADLDSIMQWVSRNQLEMACHKCEVLHLGKNNPRQNYHIGEVNLKSAEKIKILGVVVTLSLNFTTHITEIVQRAATRSRMINRVFHCRDPSFKIKLFITYVRPILEYASEVWSPILKKDINLLESVQRRFTKVLLYDYDLTYEERLVNLNIETLEIRRSFKDLIFCYKVLNNVLDIESDKLFTLTPHGRLTIPKSNSNRHRQTFCIRCINPYNALSQETRQASNVYQFKKYLLKENLSDLP